MLKKINSQAALARAIGVAPMTISHWIHDSRWTFARKAPWPMSIVPKVKAWVEANLDRRSTPMTPQQRAVFKQLDIEKMQLQVRIARIREEKENILASVVSLETYRMSDHGRALTADFVETWRSTILALSGQLLADQFWSAQQREGFDQRIRAALTWPANARAFMCDVRSALKELADAASCDVGRAPR